MVQKCNPLSALFGVDLCSSAEPPPDYASVGVKVSIKSTGSLVPLNPAQTLARRSGHDVARGTAIAVRAEPADVAIKAKLLQSTPPLVGDPSCLGIGTITE